MPYAGYRKMGLEEASLFIFPAFFARNFDKKATNIVSRELYSTHPDSCRLKGGAE